MVEFIENREKKSEEFHMVIISTHLQLPPFFKKIVEEPLGLKRAHKVEHPEDSSLKPIAKEGITVAGGITLG